MIIDSHAHVRCYCAENIFPEGLKGVGKYVDKVLHKANHGTIASAYDKISDIMNRRDNMGLKFIPKRFEESLQKFVILSNIPFNSQRDENQLLETMQAHEVDYAIIIAREPVAPNQTLLDISQRIKKLFTVVHLKYGAKNVIQSLAEYKEMGAVGVKIHPTLDGHLPKSIWYKKLVQAASELNLPIICHTGNSSYVGADHGEYSDIENYDALVKSFPNTTFVMAHANLGRHDKAIEFAKKHKNVFIETSWQSQENVLELYHRLGSEKILFGTDWPILGDQIKVHKRILDGLKFNRTQDYENYCFRNAIDVFGLKL